ncbi:ABC transporter family protein, partial [Vibrio parahaemolyticus V-223/04]
CVSF